MPNNSIKFYKDGKVESIMGLVFLLMLLIGSIAFMIVEHDSTGALVVMGLMSFMFATIFLYILITPFYVILDTESVTEINAFGKIKKKHELNSLKEIRIIRGHVGYLSIDYLYFNFSEKDYSDYEVKDLRVEDDITYLAYFEKYNEIIKEFTDVPIIDMRPKRKK